ncbi:uncharacterized protein LOC100877621 isoform X2 [Megachile rotundata]|uniref:uncharacterized protein LOC100877621 isoform X2 n=1 Tax=Megachile rotundata TaxID=143995 RepID=UPI003FD49993
MDEYDKKFAEMQKYIPFLEAMIERLKNVKDKSREVQLQKMQSLHGILSNSKRKLKIETLQRCEDVLQKLHNKVEKGNTPGLHFPNKKNEANSAQTSTAMEGKSQPVEETMEDKEIHETPASPSPPVSPDSGSQVEPIIIPTERKVEFDKPASPDPIETLPTKAPIIIPTERTSNDLSLSPSSQRSSKNVDDVSFVEWDMLEGNESQIGRTKNWQGIVTSGHDVASGMKLGSSDGRPHVPISMHSTRHIPTIPVPSLGGSRRLSSILEKTRLAGGNLESESRPESPMSVSDTRLKSPDSEILYSKHGKNTSPRLKEARPSKPSVPLLLSPPPVSTEPPLSMEDLAELLNEEDDNKLEKKGDAVKLKKDKSELNALNKDSKQSKPFLLSQEDIDSESERRWEEIDKHIVKLTSRKCLSTGVPAKGETLKLNEIKGPSPVSLGHNTGSLDSRNRPSSPGSKVEPRFADNYERHPRRLIDDDIPNPLHPANTAKSDNSLLYQRRQGNVGPEMVPPRIETEFRTEGPEYFNRQVPNPGHWPPMHPPVNTNEFCNNQWPQTSNFSGMPNSPAQSYQHPMGMHQEMWNVGAGSAAIHIDPHQMNEGQLRPNQFPSNMNTGIRPLMSPTTRPQDMNHIPRPEDLPPVDVPNVPNIQPLISPTRFPVGPQYRNFPGENRPYDPSFDRGHPRQSWDSPANRPNEVPYRQENEVPCNVIGPTDGPTGPFPRPSTPCPWNRDRDRGGGRGRNYYNDRSRAEPRNNFNRDSRRPEWARDNHNEWDNSNRFGRDARNISDRDPRVRAEHNTMNQSPNQPRDNVTSVRDPRLAKDKHFPPAKNKDSTFNERNSRKRPTAPVFPTSSFRKSKEKLKSPPKPVEGHRRTDAENSGKQDKSSKEKMQSPLETLYGVIDTKAKSAQGYCLQNFKIPKIKRNESLESPTSSHVSEEAKSECDKESKAIKRDKDDATAEVSSSSDGNIQSENWNDSSDISDKKEDPKEESSATVEDKSDSNIAESDSISTTCPKTAESAEKKKEDAESEGPKSKDEVTQEWIEALIRKSFEFGEGKKFVEQAKFMQKLGEVLQAKKLKKIKKIIESESESSSSDKDDAPDTKKVLTKKKRRVIVSDSSDEESLAERLDILKAKSKENESVDDQKEEVDKKPEKISTESSDVQPKSEIVEQAVVKDEVQVKDETKENTVSAEKVDDTLDTKDSVKDESLEDKDRPKTPKAKAKRRNSLEMLQEDIREMFICDGVVAATGHRLCRTQKEQTQPNSVPSTSSPSTPTTKKDESSKPDAESDTEEALDASKQKKKSRTSEELNKSKSKSKKDTKRVTRQCIKQYPSSDSEEDQPLAFRTELIQNVNMLSNQDSRSDDSDMLRRSKRIVNKETIKEPRVVVEKTDISKLDNSKVMFDSSSDESFGIDVSELAAAVDISLHPDKQVESETPETTEKKKSNQSASKKAAKKKGNESVTESKVDDQFSDEESIVSDISMSSSVASGKKANDAAQIESNANEELLSNILVGLVPSKSDTDKDTSVASKGSDVDLDDLPAGLSPDMITKKVYAKKKKKKCNWRMGILSKKKRKRTPAASNKADTDLNSSSELGSIKADASSPSEDKVSEVSSLNDTQGNSEKLENTSQISDDDVKDQKVEQPPVSVDLTEKKKALKPTNVKEPEKKDVKEKAKELDRSLLDLDVNKLIYYAWSGKERYKCLLCFFTGKNIVHHYKLSHPGKEILISRLQTSDARVAIQEAKDTNMEAKSSKPLTEEIYKFRCRICSFLTEGAAKVAMEAFYEHCTTHTGEYRFRCNSCPYQAVAKSSMRTHYYKVCRRFKDTFAEAITEDDIPEKNGIYGYLCSKCNFIQLKRFNVEEHAKFWHKDVPYVDIIMINMSLDTVQEEPSSKIDVAAGKIKEEVHQPSLEKLEEPVNDPVSSVDENDVANKIETVKDDKAAPAEKKKDEAEMKSQKEEDNSEVDDGKKKKTTQEDADSSLSTGNLSVFVCPPELEKKEVEIQLERKRKMQEIIQNIGIKLQKDASKKGLSIIDKLKDKMKTNLLAENNEIVSSESPESSSKTPITFLNSPIQCEKSSTELLPTSKILETSSENSEINSVPQETCTDVQAENSVLKTSVPNTEDSQPTSEAAQTDSKATDPSTGLGQKKNDESDVETSDNENRSSAPIYESDSSSEQSDSEPSTDVNMILKETSSIGASSKDPMLTTIQRLAAQLQATKPLDANKEKSQSEEPKRAFSIVSIPKPPDVVPIASIKKFVGKLENKFHEISRETQGDSNQPKNFIRLRRLSGDMLSIPTQSPGTQEDVSTSQSNGSQSSTPVTTESILNPEKEEECSFLKIENVVSLAPRADNDENPIINDIRKAVEISPIKSQGVSVLKKSNSPFILKRLNAVAITQPLNMPATTETVKLIPVKSLSPTPVSVTAAHRGATFIPIAPKTKKIIAVNNKLPFPLSGNKTTVMTPTTTRTVTVGGSPQSPNLNYKIVKVVRTPTVLKSAESTVSSTTVVKLKSVDAYNAMLKRTKLAQLYKCMERDCRFTTDVLAQYQQHYLQHTNEAEKKKGSQPDYQKCAYCYMVLENWNQMKVHMEDKHAHCRYQCSFCFYRAIVPSYVQVHQLTAHPGKHGILLGKLLKELPTREEVNRHDFIHPYMCQHDCSKFFYVPESFMAHLKNKHASVLSTFKCHVCRVTCLKVEQLMMHYKMHGFYKYQCLYCLNGSDTINEMHNHLSIFHCNRLPHILERSLPPQPVRNKDVIDQLVVRTFDDNIKFTEEVIDLENEGKDTKDPIVVDIVNTPTSPKSSLNLTKDLNMVNKDENEILNKSIYNLFGMGSNSNNSINSDVSQSGKLSLSDSCNDNASTMLFGNLDDVDVSVMAVSNSDAANKILLDKNEDASIVSDSAIEPLEPSTGTFDSTDEFVNINLLDNPDFLKNVNSCSSDVTNNTTVNESKAEDSDIEIVDIDDAGTVLTKDDKSDLKKIDNFEEKAKVDPQENDKKEQLDSNVENVNASTDVTKNSSNNSPVKKSDKPMTLEDIKDTGFIGTKLYRCGYESCDYGAQTASTLRVHIKECASRGPNKCLNCVHCNKRFIKVGFLLEHLKSHGLKRFGCSLCKMRCTVGYQAIAHMKMKHKYAYSKLVPADPKNPSVDGLFIVQPVFQSGERKGKKRKSTKSADKEGEKVSTDLEKFSFGPDEIDSLPLQAIYIRAVQCAVCPYTTKVRTNIIRHLRLHAIDESVPESGPVNPVPCLDKKERMFDKMVNLASSSHQNGRMGGKPKEPVKDNDDEFIPKFVPEHKRYVCGVAECNYLTVDEAMLRCHLKALHSEEQYFRCPHCPQPPPGQEGLNIAIDKMAVHLKMHDTRLYKCSHCNHHHYHRHVVERHLSDKHPEKRPFVKVIRELENTENNQQSVQEEVEEQAPDPDGNHWKCNICDYKCVYKAEMVNHATVTHDEKCQYKCNLCSFKTSGKIMFDQHINSKHPNDANVDYILMYQRIKGVNKKSADNIEQGGQDEPFDTTPLWRRDMPRIRHIRGILLEEEDEGSTESSLKAGKRKSDSDLAAVKPAKIKPGKSSSLDDSKQLKDKCKRTLFGDKADAENVKDTSAASDKNKEAKTKLIEDNDSNDSDVGRFGPYGKSDGNMYVCTLCTQFKSKYKHDMRDHLFRELNYARWHCQECGYLSVNRNALFKHFAKHHNGERPNHEPLSPDDDIEEWVGTLLKRQTLMIKEFLSKQNANNTDTPVVVNTSGSDNKSPPNKITQNTVTKTSKNTNLAGKSPNTKDSKVQNVEVNLNVQDDNVKDNDSLIIDMGDDKEKTEKTTESDKAGAEDEREKTYVCKYCKMTFTRWQGYNLHVQYAHLKRLGFKCPYCDRTTKCEKLMLQHMRLKHRNCPEKLIQNLSETEYGFPKRSKKRKRKISDEKVPDHDATQEQANNSETQEKCNICSFTAMNLTGLRAHMRIHSPKNTLKCSYCTFAASTKTDLWEHWKQNHPFSPFKSEDIPTSESLGDSENVKEDNKSFSDDYNDDIEEEQISDSTDDEIGYCCFYCSFRSRSLDMVQNHWTLVHSESKLENDSLKLKSNCPFRYKKIHLLSEKPIVKAQCSKTETETPYELYLQQSHDDVQIIEASGTKDGWICQWCNELCDSEVKIKTHHSMFHSHLPLNFKKQDRTRMLKGYTCPECSFTTTFINVMKSHVSKHINLLKCKYCDKTFSSASQVSSHNAEEHPDMELKIESIQNYEAQLESIMAKVKWQKSSSQDQVEVSIEPAKSHAVARKSTTKNSIRPNLISYKIKAVARKSTNPHSRYLFNNKMNDQQQSVQCKGFSYYGLPRIPVNLAKLNTYMVVGGHRMKVNCTTLAQLININPKIILQDVKYDIKNMATIKKLK